MPLPLETAVTASVPNAEAEATRRRCGFRSAAGPGRQSRGPGMTGHDDGGDDVQFGLVAGPVDEHHSWGQPDSGERVGHGPATFDRVGGQPHRQCHMQRTVASGCRWANSRACGTRNASAGPGCGASSMKPRAPGTEIADGRLYTEGSAATRANSFSWSSTGAWSVSCCWGTVVLASGRGPTRSGSPAGRPFPQHTGSDAGLLLSRARKARRSASQSARTASAPRAIP